MPVVFHWVAAVLDLSVKLIDMGRGGMALSAIGFNGALTDFVIAPMSFIAILMRVVAVFAGRVAVLVVIITVVMNS